MPTPTEIVYINGGEIYKSPTAKDLDVIYKYDASADRIFPFVKNDGKRYFCTTEFKSYFDGGNGVDLSGFDLCPQVSLWLALGAKSESERSDFDLFFHVDSVEQLHGVASYYNLPYPVDVKTDSLIDSAPDSISRWNAKGKHIVTGAIKFIDGVPSLLKLYTYPKAFGSWDVWMYGASYFDGGKCWEKGAVYFKDTGGQVLEGANMRHANGHTRAEVIYTERADGIHTSYKYEKLKDPVLGWRGEEIDASGTISASKYYESSYAVRMMVGSMSNGAKLAEYDLCPDVFFWIGRSWIDSRDEVELLFAITGGSAQLQAVSNYYQLPFPISQDMAQILDTNKELYRARHYDIYGRGEGNWEPVIVASIVLVDGKPDKLLFYTFMRPWEFDEQIELPAFA